MVKKARPEAAKGDERLTSLKSRIAGAPKDPGIYRWIDAKGAVLYVGKAKNLRNRLRSYVASDGMKDQGPWKMALASLITDFDVTITNTELEALLLETNLIKELRPKYNVLMKDDKNHVYLRVEVKDRFPTVSVVRKMEKDGAKYFGPYLRAYDLYRMLDLLQMVLQYRACKESIGALNRDPENIQKLRGCLDHQIGQCNGLCAGAITEEEYRRRIDALTQFFGGKEEAVEAQAREMMANAATDRKFERAAELRNALEFIAVMREKQVVSDTSLEDIDAIGVALLSGKAQVMLLRKRGGRLISEEHISLQGLADDAGAVLSQFLPQYYSDCDDFPDIVLVPAEFPDRDILAEWLTQQRGKKVDVKIPERGKKSSLLDLAIKNAQEKAKQSEAKWEADARNTEEALTQLKQLLQLPAEPHRIEGYDISHLGGTETVGSMVVMIGGKPRNDQYRNFTIRTLQRGDVDDYQSLKEVLSRRLRHLLGGIKAEEQRWKDEGITIRKSKKKDEPALQKLFNREACDDATLAEKEGELIAASLIGEREGLTELCSLWVDPSFADGSLTSFLVRKTLQPLKTKVYTIASPDLEAAYASVGFRYVQRPPAAFVKNVDEEHILLVSDPKDQKPDSSLTTKPDLIMIDGGKGQLSTVVDVLKSWNMQIPVIGLAKREEEVFLPPAMEPIAFPKDSPAKFLLMRLRDEAHRFANAHRKKRTWKTFIQD